VHLTYAPYALFDEWRLAGWLVGAGGVLLFLSGALFLYVIAMTVWFSRSPAQVEVPEAKPLHPVERMPLVLDRITPWVTVSVVLIAIAWLPSIYRIATTHPYVQGWRLW